MKIEDIKWLHVEASSKCNAWCPACPRNNNGIGLKDGLVLEDLALNRLQEILNQLPMLDCVQFCGNYGDPIIAHNILELVAVTIPHTKKIQIHTNGSLRTTEWWSNLANILSNIDHDVWFGIDGLEGVHEIYRQGTSYQKIIDNAQAFIDAGGKATWQYIPYAHNEHQVTECIKLSQQIGFTRFKLVKLYRNKKMARHYQTGEKFDLLPPKEFQQIIKMQHQKNDNIIVNKDSCMHLAQSSIYLSANGKLSNCCHFERAMSFDTLGYDGLNVYYNTLAESADADWLFIWNRIRQRIC